MEITLSAFAKMMFICLALVTLASPYVMRQPAEDDYQTGYVVGPDDFQQPAAKRNWEEEKDCPIYRIDQLHLVMDRVCEMCHEMFSHSHSNLRAECRASCFDNIIFRKCVKVFSETGNTGHKPSYKPLL